MDNSTRNKIIIYILSLWLASSLALFAVCFALLKARTEREVLHYQRIEEMQEKANQRLTEWLGNYE